VFVYNSSILLFLFLRDIHIHDKDIQSVMESNIVHDSSVLHGGGLFKLVAIDTKSCSYSESIKPHTTCPEHINARLRLASPRGERRSGQRWRMLRRFGWEWDGCLERKAVMA
jgi:hypothetical protein